MTITPGIYIFSNAPLLSEEDCQSCPEPIAEHVEAGEGNSAWRMGAGEEF